MSPERRLSQALREASDIQRSRENRAALADWLRRVAEKISPDNKYQRIRGRVVFGSGLVFTYTPLTDESDEPSPDGVRVYIRSADREQIVRR